MNKPKHNANSWIIEQKWENYSQSEHDIWLRLYDRQYEILRSRACKPFLDGLDALDLHGRGIPDFRQLNQALKPLTGWEVVAVPGLVPDIEFFDLLANRKFPAGRFIRKPSEFDYIEAPDIFHDVYGHVPLLTNHVFADYMQAYGKGGQRAYGNFDLKQLARLYWYSVEFGLIRENGAMKIYGAGILSSPAESVFALESPSPNRVEFDLTRLMRTNYKIDDFQDIYFVIDDFDELFQATLQDFEPIYRSLKSASAFSPNELTAGDKVVTYGNHEYLKK
ncbi:MAG: phenylalanine-4-hydroxylase [Hyphomonadaceae bacterium]|nr:MAG: phenylalanine-4-hydroxylase [Hyphomonadaceae bacterium]KAF0186354.1 MAG: phenylalanine-4-hydroxylase [Hyphomonadaceae bacterium]